MGKSKDIFAKLSIYIKGALMGLADLLYPERCVCCDKVLGVKEKGCCMGCMPKLPRIEGNICMKCGKPVEDDEEFCSDCMAHDHFFDKGTAAFIYTGAIRHSIYRMKFQNRRDYIPFYAQEMVHAIEGRIGIWRPELILPIPMHWKKKRQRGYNQSELLAKRISLMTGIPAANDLLKCIRKMPDQKKLNREQRMKNIHGIIEVSKEFPKVRSVLLIDDVYTTGSTVDEVSRVLKHAGVQHVYFVVLCIGKGKKAVCTATKM